MNIMTRRYKINIMKERYNIMRKRVFSTTMLLALLVSMILMIINPGTSYAEESNKKDVRAGISAGGCYVV